MHNFDFQAPHYDSSSDVQIELGDALFEMALDFLPEKPPVLLDLGCGTGHLSLDLASLCPKRLDCLDIAPSMLAQCQAKLQEYFPMVPYRLFEGDAESFEPDCSYDAIFSNAAIQWFQHLPAFLAKAKHWLNPGGTIALGTFGPKTLKELHKAYQHATQRPMPTATRFISESGLSGLLQKNGFHGVEGATCLYTQSSESPREFLRSLKRMGVTGGQVTPGLTRQELQRLETQLALTGTPESPVNITWELVVLIAKI